MEKENNLTEILIKAYKNNDINYISEKIQYYINDLKLPYETVVENLNKDYKTYIYKNGR